MREKAEDFIPQDVLDAAAAAGLGTPLWYVGPRSGDVKIKTGLGYVVAKAYEEAGLPPPKLVDSDEAPPQKD